MWDKGLQIFVCGTADAFLSRRTHELQCFKNGLMYWPTLYDMAVFSVALLNSVWRAKQIELVLVMYAAHSQCWILFWKGLG